MLLIFLPPISEGNAFTGVCVNLGGGGGYPMVSGTRSLPLGSTPARSVARESTPFRSMAGERVDDRDIPRIGVPPRLDMLRSVRLLRLT